MTENVINTAELLRNISESGVKKSNKELNINFSEAV